MPAPDLTSTLQSARALDEAGQPADAMAEAWRALDMAPGDAEAKALVARLLSRHRKSAVPGRREDMARLLADPEVDPLLVASAAWESLLEPDAMLSRTDEPEALAAWIEQDALAIRLLEETYVPLLEAERPLTALRRWLLLSNRWPEFPRLVAALAAQAVHNGGAWPLEAEEKARLEVSPKLAIAAAYSPRRSAGETRDTIADPVARAVAEQYEGWPYPIWSRLTAPVPTTVPAAVEKLDQGRDSSLPVAAEVLVAGCGTGREAAIMARRFPDARITAIDISKASLAYAAERCRALGIDAIDFRLLDLRRAADLGKDFDLIFCSGVLHHLPDPEAGWATLVDVLRPGGAMRIMVYSKVGRLPVRAARSHVADLLDRPIDDDLLREARRRLIDKAPRLLAEWRDFYTLGGVHDLLLHRHEDPFDVPRIVRALDRLGLELLAFELPTPCHRARYRQENPNDPAFRDVKAWAALELKNPFLFRSMYEFWCRKPAQ